MQIVVLASEELKSELLSGGEPTAAVHWVTNPSEAEGHQNADAVIDLLFEESAERSNQLRRVAPQLVLVNSVEKLKAENDVVRFNGWPGFLKGKLVEAAAPEALKAAAEVVFRAFHKTVEWVPDTHGFVSARVVSMIIGEAYRALEEGVSTEAEIDAAMKLGTNYPYGPFEWANKIGRARVAALLQSMAAYEPHYAPTNLLTR